MFGQGPTFLSRRVASCLPSREVVRTLEEPLREVTLLSQSTLFKLCGSSAQATVSDLNGELSSATNDLATVQNSLDVAQSDLVTAGDQIVELQAQIVALQAKIPSTITCVKGKLTQKVTAVNPKCPVGYKLKV